MWTSVLLSPSNESSTFRDRPRADPPNVTVSGLNRTRATNSLSSLSLLSLQNDHSHSPPRIVGIVFISGLQMIATWEIRLAIVYNDTSVVLLMMKYD
jgi:hypothetical protein